MDLVTQSIFDSTKSLKKAPLETNSVPADCCSPPTCQTNQTAPTLGSTPAKIALQLSNHLPERGPTPCCKFASIHFRVRTHIKNHLSSICKDMHTIGGSHNRTRSLTASVHATILCALTKYKRTWCTEQKRIHLSSHRCTSLANMNSLSKYQDAVIMIAIIGFACKTISAVAWSSDEKSAFCAWTRKCRNWQTQPAKSLHIHNSTENTTHMLFGNLEIILSLGLRDVSTDGQKALHELLGLESLQSEELRVRTNPRQQCLHIQWLCGLAHDVH